MAIQGEGRVDQARLDKSKHFKAGELRYLPGKDAASKDAFQLTLRTQGMDTVTFTGALDNKTLALERPEKDDVHRLVFTFLHANRFLYRYEVKPAGKALFAKQFWVGATKEGVPFAAGDGKPECIVSGGAGTIAVVHMGTTYYVCCGGCRDEFRENPEKYIKEFADKKKAKK